MASLQAFFQSWLDDGWFILWRVIAIIVIIAVSGPTARYAARAVRKIFARIGENTHIPMEQRRANTFGTLLSSIVRYGIWSIAAFFALYILGLSNLVTTLLATAGISGLVIGFGAQKLIQDFFAGFVFITDHPFAVGDLVTILGVTGIVEALRIRTTGIRSHTGELHIIPNGSISTVTNHSRGNSMAIVDIYVPVNQPFEAVKQILQHAANEATRELDTIIEPPQVLGIVSFTDRGMMCLRTTCRTKPLQHYAIERLLRQAMLAALQQANMI